MSKLHTVVFKYGSASRVIGEAMSVATTGSSGSLQAEVIDIRMDINDDDEDVASFLGAKEHNNLQIVNRRIYIGCNTPFSLQKLNIKYK